jgi:D-alanyl-D-alanine carboxypeptidase-like protein
VPSGVVSSPSRWCAETPFLPIRAGHGPAARDQHAPRRCHSASVARVACGRAASTVTSCVVPPRIGSARYWGFDGSAHTGELVVSAAVTRPVVTVFARLYRARFPIRRMQPVDAFRGSDERSMAADNTSAFNCRYAVAPGSRRWSVHAYGEAIDVNPVENPYLDGGRVRPPAGALFRDRARVRPGMAVAGGALVRAFAGVGWPWGGRWASPDYQHFSATGR